MFPGRTSEDVSIAVDCLQIMISKRKKQVRIQKPVHSFVRCLRLLEGGLSHGLVSGVSPKTAVLHQASVEPVSSAASSWGLVNSGLCQKFHSRQYLFVENMFTFFSMPQWLDLSFSRTFSCRPMWEARCCSTRNLTGAGCICRSWTTLSTPTPPTPRSTSCTFSGWVIFCCAKLVELANYGNVHAYSSKIFSLWKDLSPSFFVIWTHPCHITATIKCCLDSVTTITWCGSTVSTSWAGLAAPGSGSCRRSLAEGRSTITAASFKIERSGSRAFCKHNGGSLGWVGPDPSEHLAWQGGLLRELRSRAFWFPISCCCENVQEWKFRSGRRWSCWMTSAQPTWSSGLLFENNLWRKNRSVWIWNCAQAHVMWVSSKHESCKNRKHDWQECVMLFFGQTEWYGLKSCFCWLWGALPAEIEHTTDQVTRGVRMASDQSYLLWWIFWTKRTGNCFEPRRLVLFLPWLTDWGKVGGWKEISFQPPTPPVWKFHWGRWGDGNFPRRGVGGKFPSHPWREISFHPGPCGNFIEMVRGEFPSKGWRDISLSVVSLTELTAACGSFSTWKSSFDCSKRVPRKSWKRVPSDKKSQRNTVKWLTLNWRTLTFMPHLLQKDPGRENGMWTTSPRRRKKPNACDKLDQTILRFRVPRITMEGSVRVRVHIVLADQVFLVS